MSENRELYLTQKIKNLAYNLRYKAMSFIDEYNANTLVHPNETIFILGKKFTATEENAKEVNEEIFRTFENLVWITYRSGFPQLPNELVGSYISDTGWGCMVRVGQMLFAQLIRHHYGFKQKKDVLSILEYFNDAQKSQPFSIQNIAKYGRIQYGLKPGEWYNPSQISFILSQLNDLHLIQSSQLKFIPFNSGNLFFDFIVESMLDGSPICECEQKKNQIVCLQCNKAKYSAAVIVLTRIGLNQPEQKYLHVLDKIMEMEEFQGLIGGKPEKALYFVGKHKNQYIYLDPHYVQGIEKNLTEQGETYFCQSLRKCNNTSIDSSIGISFYLRDLSQLKNFYKNIHKIRQENLENFFIFMADKTPKYAKNMVKTTKNSQKFDIESEIFEVL